VRRPLALGVTAVAVILCVVLIVRSRPPAAERGRRLAERIGCFACHGPGGTRGAANPGRTDKEVPNFEGDLMMYAKTPEEIREWIRDGSTAKRRRSETWREERRKGALRMPGFRRRLEKRQIEDLVAYVMAVSGMPAPPESSLAAHGLARAEALGCVGCHGAGGRLAIRNPRSLKGYVPPWDGQDFSELVKSRAEFGEWVERGVSRRFERDAMARFFLRRAVLKMPPYEKHLELGDVDALWAYVQWLRSTDLRAASVERPAEE
jgi:mono/diheme cytochrome c family protein